MININGLVSTLFSNNLILGKFSTLSTNFYFLDLFKFQTEAWRQNVTNIVDKGILDVFFLRSLFVSKKLFL